MKAYMAANWPRLVLAVAIAIVVVAMGVPDPMAAGVAMAAPFMLGELDVKELKRILQEQGEAWEEFKKTNDAALKAGKTDLGEVKEKLAKVNEALTKTDDSITRFQKAMQEVEARQQRMQFDMEPVGLDARGHPVIKLSSDEKEHKAAFQKFMRKGTDDGLGAMEAKAMSAGSEPDGGYLLPRDTSGQMVRRIFETSPMRQYAAVQGISTDALEGPNDLNDGVFGGWVSEAGSRPTTGTPQLGRWRIPVHEMYCYPLITQTLLDDAAVDPEAWLMGKTTDKMARIETTAFFTGTGAGQPRGLLTYTTAATADVSRAWGVFEHVASGASGAYPAAPGGSDRLVDLVHKVKAFYRAGSAFWMAKATLGETRKLKDSAGNYVWLPAVTAAERGIAGVPPSTLIGYPVIEAEDMPALGAGSLSVGFGNMGTTYQIVDRVGIRVLRDPFSNKPYIGFYITRRVGGDVLHFEQFKFLKFS